MSKFRTLALLAAFFGLFALGCSEGSEEGPTGGQEGPPPVNLVGVWTYQSVTVNGAPSTLAEVLDWVPGAVAAEIQIFENGAFVYQEVNQSGGQLWFESGFVFFNDAGEVDVNVLSDSNGTADRMSTFTFTASDDTLTLRQVGGANVVIFTLTK